MSKNPIIPGLEFKNLVALITGGAGGIGSATAEYLHSRGAKIAIIDVVSSKNENYFSVVCDITNDEEVKSAVTKIFENYGRIDILINNAGIGAIGNITENSDAEWTRLLDVNVMGAVRVTRATLDYLKKSPSAAIVNTCSIVAGTGLRNRALYSATKGALEALTRAMAADLLPERIRVNAVSPGTADTPWVERLIAAAEDPIATSTALIARQPMKRLISSGEVAHAIGYLANPLSASTTGTVLAVDAGFHSLRID